MVTDARKAKRRSVVVCNRSGEAIREADVLEVHRGEGVLHKAFSILVFRRTGSDLLIQQRSERKALFPLRWANTCCSHPSPDDTNLVAAAQRRLQEEMGFTVDLREAGAFVYRAKDPQSQLSEYEHDTVLVGAATGSISVEPDPDEIADWQWISVARLQRDLDVDTSRSAPKYAPWLAQALRVALEECQ